MTFDFQSLLETLGIGVTNFLIALLIFTSWIYRCAYFCIHCMSFIGTN
jgi:hypothetical protein